MKFLIIIAFYLCLADYQLLVGSQGDSEWVNNSSCCGGSSNCCNTGSSNCCNKGSSSCCNAGSANCCDRGSSCNTGACQTCSAPNCNQCCSNNCAQNCQTTECKQECTKGCTEKCKYEAADGSNQTSSIDIQLTNSIQTTNEINIPINISLTNNNNVVTSSKDSCCESNCKPNETPCRNGSTIVTEYVTVRVPYIVPSPYPVREHIPITQILRIPVHIPVDRPVHIPVERPVPYPYQGCPNNNCPQQQQCPYNNCPQQPCPYCSWQQQGLGYSGQFGGSSLLNQLGYSDQNTQYGK